MPQQRIFALKLAKLYPLYVQKAERKNRTKEEVDQIICWLTGYDPAGLQQIKDPLMQKIRYLDKLIDELAKGKALDKIMR